MTDIDINTLVLGWITTYGSPMVAVLLLIGATGIPIPGTLIVIVSGAFIRQNFLDLYSTTPLALLGTVLGDLVLYSVGRFARVGIQKRFGSSAIWQKSSNYFVQRGDGAIFFTRWLVTSLATPINLIAGSSDYSFKKFLLFDIGGEMTWLALYGTLGYIFGSQWELISDFISEFSGMIIGLVVLGVGVYVLVRFSRSKKPAEQPQPVETVEAVEQIEQVELAG